MNSGEELIKAFLIFEKKSGRPYIHRIYPGFNADPFLLIGFLNAMIKFAKEAMLGKKAIKLIDMQDLRFAFMESNKIIFTAVSSNLNSPLDLEFKIKTIESLFLETFSKEELSDATLSIEHYNPFTPIVDEIIQGEVKYVKDNKVENLKSQLDEYKEKNDNILGLAIISFTGIVIVNSLQPKHYDLISKLINNLFSTQISGIRRFNLELTKLHVYIELISIDSYLLYVTDKQYLKCIEDENFSNFKNKISKILKQG
ncbi:MAG: hypothetical protein EU549_03295 [Promethearchaeota archaeon]|nr:MAG: hypothetical protein EU549_03295 [Candidatus Lokiarchaeota archaeon]